MNMLAHLTEKNGVRAEQSLQEHCIHTAEYASKCLKSVGFYHMAYLAGLLHDMGKATEKFRHYLEDAFCGKTVVRGSVNHTFAGVIFLLENYHGESAPPMERLTAEIISYAIGAHHGLFDCVSLEGKNGFSYRLDKDRNELCYEEALYNFLEQVADRAEIESLFRKATDEFRVFYEKTLTDWDRKSQKVFSQISLLTRLLLSVVIYGDRRDTGEFMQAVEFSDERAVPWTSERQCFERKLSLFNATSEMNQIRSLISAQCLEAAQNPSGIYRLNVPTGAGKTLCTLRYALAHAEKFHKKKIIFIIPLLSVLDQNAKVIREYMEDEQIVLEHHSNVISEKEFTESGEELDRYEILTENWDKPIIISTLVQLLDILFLHKTSAIGRMRALCDSVIVIDEVQSIPKKTIAMFNMALNFLHSCCNATIVLSSATQPCLEELDWPVRFAEQPDMVRLNKRQLKVFERAEIIDKTTPHGMDMDELADFCRSTMEGQESLLVICNTKREAGNLFERLKADTGAAGWYLCHLSTAMCQRHRMDVLDKLQKKLAILQDNVRNHLQTEKIVCISTQLVEAGVDFSFSCVVRVLAGIDNLAQAAGRCNRSNEYGHKGQVYLVNLKAENLSMLKEIAEAQNSTLHVLANRDRLQGEELIGENSSKLFYQNLFQGKNLKRQIKYPIEDQGTEIFLADLLANANPYAQKEKGYYLHQPFKTAAGKFQVFDDETFDVLVPYEKGTEVIEEIRKAEKTAFPMIAVKEILQQAKGYSISIYRWQRDRLMEAGLLLGLLEDRVFILDRKAYDGQRGLDDRAELSVESYIL